MKNATCWIKSLKCRLSRALPGRPQLFLQHSIHGQPETQHGKSTPQGLHTQRESVREVMLFTVSQWEIKPQREACTLKQLFFSFQNTPPPYFNAKDCYVLFFPSLIKHFIKVILQAKVLTRIVNLGYSRKLVWFFQQIVFQQVKNLKRGSVFFHLHSYFI